MTTESATNRIDLTFGALDAVRLERVRQDAKWGRQRHSWPEWMTILTEEVGEASQYANWLHWSRKDDDPLPEWAMSLREELVQVAAVACAIVEHIDEITAPTPARSHAAGTPGEGV